MKKIFLIFAMLMTLAAATLMVAACQEQETTSMTETEYETTQISETLETQEETEEQETEGERIPPEIVEFDLHSLLEIANRRRLELIRPDAELLRELTAGRAPETINIEEFWQERQHQFRIEISLEEALEDLSAFFDVIQQVYGSYTYFGGDEVFIPVFDNIIEEVSQNEQNGTVSISRFADIVYRQLDDVIFDNHFFFNGNVLGIRHNFFRTNSLFDKISTGEFYHRESGKIVVAIENHDINQIMRLSTDEDGNIFYSPIVYRDEISMHYAINMIFEDGTSQELLLNIFSPRRITDPPPSSGFVDGTSLDFI
ncbi:MAG: hypothetical protein FWD01_00560, partial [Defluviitaleaceae bacterium]|nr:hypothetical protein [Defluviitaleaceae bacterium]